MEFAPVAVIVINRDDVVTYVNSNWYDLTGHPRLDGYNKIDWRITIHQEDLGHVEAAWAEQTSGESVSIQFRLKSKQRGSDGTYLQTWVMGKAWPEMENGSFKQTLVSTYFFRSTRNRTNIVTVLVP